MHSAFDYHTCLTHASHGEYLVYEWDMLVILGFCTLWMVLNGWTTFWCQSHVLANEISLNLKYYIGLKHFFNINLGIGIIKKPTFLFVFSTYLPVVLLKFWSGELIWCRIKFRIQRVPTRHTFDGSFYPKNKKYLKQRDDDIRYFLFLG